jgi:alkylation response protein AidB-like acyl-CoA dehydrogenase
MKLEQDPEIDRFRAEVRGFLEKHRPAVHTMGRAETRAPEAEDIPALRTWTAQLFGAGYVGADWPAEWGGAGTKDAIGATVVGAGAGAHADRRRPAGRRGPHPLRAARPAEALPAPDPDRRGHLVPALQRAQRWQRPGEPVHPRASRRR